MFRQGDVLVRSSQIPSGATPIKEKELILALGEATGHHHRIMVADVPNVEAYEKDGVMYLHILEDAKPVILEHEEHAPITLPTGDYEVMIQREYTPEEIRRVQD